MSARLTTDGSIGLIDICSDLTFNLDSVDLLGSKETCLHVYMMSFSRFLL